MGGFGAKLNEAGPSLERVVRMAIAGAVCATQNESLRGGEERSHRRAARGIGKAVLNSGQASTERSGFTLRLYGSERGSRQAISSCDIHRPRLSATPSGKRRCDTRWRVTIEDERVSKYSHGWWKLKTLRIPR